MMALTDMGMVSGFVCSFSSREAIIRISTGSSCLGVRVDMAVILPNLFGGALLIFIPRGAIVHQNFRDSAEYGWNWLQETSPRPDPSTQHPAKRMNSLVVRNMRITRQRGRRARA